MNLVTAASPHQITDKGAIYPSEPRTCSTNGQLVTVIQVWPFSARSMAVVEQFSGVAGGALCKQLVKGRLP
jgi:hypothetical protein